MSSNEQGTEMESGEEAGMGGGGGAEGAKKTDLKLLVALMVAVVGGGGYLVYKNLGGGPANASGAVVEAGMGAGGGAGNAAVKQAVDGFLADGGKDLKSMERALRHTEEVVKGFLELPGRTQVPLSALKTDPFRIEVMESEKKPAAEVQQEQARVARLKAMEEARKRAAELRVEMVMVGRARGAGTAMINGETVRVGQVVAGLVLEEVRANGVVVRDSEFRFALPVSGGRGGAGTSGPGKLAGSE